MLRAECIGTVSRKPKVIELGQGKKPFVSVNILVVKAWGEKEYRSYVDVNVYGRGMDETLALNQGDLVFASGDASARTNEGTDGKTYANVTIVGTVQRILTPAKDHTPQARHKPTQGELPTPAAPPTEDDVPF